MESIRLTKTALKDGTWFGVAVAPGRDGLPPSLSAWHLETQIDGLDLAFAGEEGHWAVELPLPQAVLSDGVQTILFRDDASDEIVGSVTVAAGSALDEDFRAEVELIRAELDLLKRAFRRHCAETMP